MDLIRRHRISLFNSLSKSYQQFERDLESELQKRKADPFQQAEYRADSFSAEEETAQEQLLELEERVKNLQSQLDSVGGGLSKCADCKDRPPDGGVASALASTSGMLRSSGDVL